MTIKETIKQLCRTIISLADININDYIAPSTSMWCVEYAKRTKRPSRTTVPLI